MKTNFKNEKQIASMIILTALLILSVIMVVNFGKASGGTFEFSNNGNTYTATYQYDTTSNDKINDFRIVKIEQTSNTNSIKCPITITIPEKIKDLTIAGIGGGKGKPFICDDTFNGGNLKNVYDDLSKNKGFAITLPDSVTTVNGYAFSNGLDNVNSSTNIRKLASVTMNKVSVIRDYAFCNCGSIKSVSLGNVQTIGNYAFYSCNMLENVITPKNCLAIGESAFAGNMTDVKLFVLNPNTSFGGNVSGFSGTNIISYKNSAARDYASTKFISYGDYKKSGKTIPSGCDFPASDTSFKAVFSTGGSDLYSDSKVTNTPNLAGDGVYSSYIYLTNEMITSNSGIKTTVNKAYTLSLIHI